ncbi:Threonine/homoserine/homoserine lactone efflux protein [Salinimicrobium sediminis]|uniref:Threonine/homoserine/homoserine lactone efflux protein n=1 Tax=Salinimicrobium sediminis TaxID=1343891 RepID=A0A285X277_9FLAO|nr:LysE family transporter [Salinimicrobium sediminis]MDX1752714.1 LysE family transporter [Salinimicrobium sediminis]SOC79408.1 Threonine/homoserine/homoserine lactone efflux protein [Salinimicrobium sediminis]
MFQDILAAIPLGFFLAFLLGPVFFVLLETAAIKGFRAAISFDIGVLFADIIFLLIAYLSTTKLLNRIKDDPALFIFGGGILVTYGIIQFIQNKRVLQHEEVPEIQKLNKRDYLGLAAKGFLLNFINIGVLGFWLGLIIVFGPQMEMETSRMSLFFGTVLGTYFVIDIFKILAAKKLNRKLTPNRIYNVKKVISVILVIFGLFLIGQGLVPQEMNQIQDQIDNITPESGAYIQYFE